jgi:hypothetical protein
VTAFGCALENAGDRILIAQLTPEARHRARLRELTADEEAAAVGVLRELAGGRADLLAEIAGIFEGTSDSGSTSRSPGRPPGCAARPGPTRRRSTGGSSRGAAD